MRAGRTVRGWLWAAIGTLLMVDLAAAVTMTSDAEGADASSATTIPLLTVPGAPTIAGQTTTSSAPPGPAQSRPTAPAGTAAATTTAKAAGPAVSALAPLPKVLGADQVVFARGSEKDLWVVRVDGTGLRPLVVHPGLEDVNPAVSPDRRRIAWVRTGGRRDGDQLLVADADGANPRVVLTGRILHPSWSHDGSRLAVISDGALVTLPSGGGTVRVLVQDVQRPRSPTWSPDGSHIVFDDMASAARPLRRVDATSGTVSELPDAGQSPRYGRDGRLVWMVSRDGGGFDLAVRGPGGVRPVACPGEGCGTPALLADGRIVHVVFGAQGTSDLALRNPDGSGERRVTSDPTPDQDPAA